MTTRRIFDNSLQQLRARVVTIEKRLAQMRNDFIVTLPIRDSASLPSEAGEGDLVLGDDGTAYKFQDGEWSPLSAAGGLVETISVPGWLSTSGLDPSRAYALSAGTIQSVHMSVGSPPAGSSLGVSLLKNGSSIGSGTISSGSYTGSITPSNTSVAIGNYFTIAITSVGSIEAGTGLVVKIAIS